jgi:dTDP-4-amino-4,6-dideoxy-D-galactose acyltransferase
MTDDDSIMPTETNNRVIRGDVTATNHEFLAWDSAFFGFSVVRIGPLLGGPKGLVPLLDLLRLQGVRLCYWATDTPLDPDVAARYGGLLVDEKQTFSAVLAGTQTAVPQNSLVTTYNHSTATDELIDLALLSGRHSRFRVDPRITDQQFRLLYETWIHKSVTGELADRILTLETDGRIAGMASLRIIDDRGHISLIAVNPTYQRRGYGVALVSSALTWFADKGIEQAVVTTQASNEGAGRLYRKCGFRLATQEFFYHFWI